MAEVQVKLVRSSSDQASIRLSDPASGELFAECPVCLPLAACVEPVVDSSRYFVIRVVDRDSGKHAFIGLGFRDRTESSDFNAALIEHQQYIERKNAAAEMRKAYEEAQTSGSDTSTATAESAARHSPHVDLGLKQPVTLKLNPLGQRAGGFLRSRSPHAGGGTLTKTFSLIFDEKNGGSIAALAPPPRAPHRTPDMEMGVSPPRGNSADVPSSDEWGSFESAAAP